MEPVEKRSLSEVIALYTLHPEFRDIYVEGLTDKLVVERFFRKNKIKEFQILEINDMDFSEYYVSNPDLRRNNKKKLAFLSFELEKYFSSQLHGISCIADKDFDEFTGTLISNSYIFYTDFTCLEMYLFNIDSLKIFYKTVLRSFPITPGITISELGKVLKEKYFIRLALQITKCVKDESTITDLKKSINIDRRSGKITFDFANHLQKILHNNGSDKELDAHLECIQLHKKKCGTDIRNTIRGHDFIHLLHLYIDKIKNDIKLSEEMLERSLYQCIDFSELAKEPLFVKLLGKYS